MSTDLGRCHGFSRVISDGTRYECRDQATSLVTAGCVHEHIGERPLCNYHAGEVKGGGQLCGECLEDVPEPHTCPLTAMENARER